MSVGQLMEAYAAVEPFTSHSNWTHGFCLHSDWALGFFFNFYFIGIHSGGRKRARTIEWLGTWGLSSTMERRLLVSRTSTVNATTIRQRNAQASSHICHYQTPESMKALTSQWLLSVGDT